MDAQIWGPGAWKFIHSSALYYPQQPSKDQKRSMRDFLTSLQDVLPCSKCRSHYRENLDPVKLDTALGSRDTLFVWTVDMHNKVNLSNQKRQLTIQEALDEMAKTYAPENNPVLACSKHRLKVIEWLVLLAALIVIILIITAKPAFPHTKNIGLDLQRTNI